MGNKRNRNNVILPQEDSSINRHGVFFPVTAQQTHIVYSTGPLPAPEVLEKYARVMPGLEKQIVAMAQQQTQHRIEIEKSREKQSQRGQLFAFILAILMIASSVLAMYLHYPWIAGTIFTTALVAVIGLFLGIRRQKSMEKPSNLPATQK